MKTALTCFALHISENGFSYVKGIWWWQFHRLIFHLYFWTWIRVHWKEKEVFKSQETPFLNLSLFYDTRYVLNFSKLILLPMKWESYHCSEEFVNLTVYKQHFLYSMKPLWFPGGNHYSLSWQIHFDYYCINNLPWIIISHLLTIVHSAPWKQRSFLSTTSQKVYHTWLKINKFWWTKIPLIDKTLSLQTD